MSLSSSCRAFFGEAFKIYVSQGRNAWSNSVLIYLGKKRSEKCIDFADIKLDACRSNSPANQHNFILFSVFICKLDLPNYEAM